MEIVIPIVLALILMVTALAMEIAYGWSSGKVPTQVIGVANNKRMGPYFASGTLKPGEFVEFVDATTVKRLSDTSKCIGVADVNNNAQARKLSKMTTAFTPATDPVTVIYEGDVVMECDSAVGVTRGVTVRGGNTDQHLVETLGAGTFHHEKGRSMMTVAAGGKTIIRLKI